MRGTCYTLRIAVLRAAKIDDYEGCNGKHAKDLDCLAKNRLRERKLRIRLDLGCRKPMIIEFPRVGWEV